MNIPFMGALTIHIPSVRDFTQALLSVHSLTSYQCIDTVMDLERALSTHAHTHSHTRTHTLTHTLQPQSPMQIQVLTIHIASAHTSHTETLHLV